MSGPGYGFKDSATTPQGRDENNQFDLPEQDSPMSLNDWMDDQNEHHGSVIQDKAAQIHKDFTANSHELACASPEIEGAIQSHQNGDVEIGVRDIGWHKSTVEIPDPLIGTIPNGELFSMIRRFNKDVFAVRSVPVSTELDLNDAWSDDYETDKLTLNLQRLYLSIILSLSSFRMQVSRLRSWKESRRTSAFCLVYIAAWVFDLLVPLILGTLVLLVSSPLARNTLFPPAPRPLVSLKTGGLQKPQAGQLGTLDTLTGAPEKEPGEAMEEEAASFIENLRHLVQRVIGMHNNPEGDGDPLESKVPKPIRKAAKAVKAKGSAMGHTQENEDEEQTKAPMEEMMWEKTKPEVLAPVVKAVPHVLGEIVDTWERMANAISSTPPFSQFSFLRLSFVLIPPFLASCFVSSYMLYKSSSFAIGFLFFGEPAITPPLNCLNRKYPNWTTFAQPKNNILMGVPTNAQLTLTLLRIGELNHTPIPPVPSSSSISDNLNPTIIPSDIPLSGSPAEKLAAIQPPVPADPEVDDGSGKSKSKSKNPLSKIASVFKSNTKAAVQSKLALDHVRAKLGSEKAKGHVGVMPKSERLVFSGPEKFKARFEGKEGWLLFAPSPGAALHFRLGDENNVEDKDDVILMRDIKELRRATAFSGKAAEVVGGWASVAGRELLGSVEVVDREDKVWRFTGVVERDEVFNRLVAQKGMCWENL